MERISRDYAVALFDIAKENSEEETVYRDLERVNEVFSEFPEYTEMLSAPSIPLQKRLAAVNEAFGKIVCEKVLSFIGILCKNSKIKTFSDCFREFEDLYSTETKTVSAEVFSAVPLSEEQKNKLCEKLEKITGKTVVLDCKIDEKLIGGVTVKVDGKIIDGSVQRRLDDIKEVIDR